MYTLTKLDLRPIRPPRLSYSWAVILALLIVTQAFLSSRALAKDNGASIDYEKLSPVQVTETEITPQQGITLIRPGDTVEVKLKVHIDPNYHAYLEQYKLELVQPKTFHLSEIQVRPTTKFLDPVTKKEKLGTVDYAEIVSLLEIPNAAQSGLHHLQMNLTYQACGEDFCLFPKQISIKKDMVVGATVSPSQSLVKAIERGWFNALLVVFFAGVLTSFTPCIFPMIPITLAILGTKGHHRSRRQRFAISLSYVLGIALTYSVLGVVAAKTGALFGSMLGHPLVVSIIAALFVVMGLSMYGLFEIRLPHFIAKHISGTQFQQGFIGAFLSGLIAGVVASPCVGPVLISILAYVAQSQNTLTGFLLLFTFALGLGQIFLVLGTFNSLMHKLPRSGPWMNNVKFIFGTMMIGMAFYYIYPVAHSALFDGLVASILIGLSIYLGAFRAKSHLHGKWGRAKKSLSLMIFIFGTVFALKSMVPEHMIRKIFPSTVASEQEPVVAKPNWYKYSDALLEKSVQEHKPVIIDFHAEWCLACKELALYTFSHPSVLELGQQFIWLEFDATSPSDQLSELQRRYGIGGLPFVVIYSKSGVQLKHLTLTGFEDANGFVKRMQEALK